MPLITCGQLSELLKTILVDNCPQVNSDNSRFVPPASLIAPSRMEVGILYNEATKEGEMKACIKIESGRICSAFQAFF